MSASKQALIYGTLGASAGLLAVVIGAPWWCSTILVPIVSFTLAFAWSTHLEKRR